MGPPRHAMERGVHRRRPVGALHVGTSGWLYPPWRGLFYPRGVTHARELAHLATRLGSVEINGSFYSLQRPSSYLRWRAQTPPGFVFAVKGGRFITHFKRLADVRAPLANFLASGVLALEEKLGPILWQLPPSFAFDEARLTSFFELLPRTTREAAALAREHDGRLTHGVYTETEVDRPLRHAIEVRHPSFAAAAFVRLLRRSRVALCVTDGAGAWPCLEDVTADFVYVRLHGDTELYASGYDDDALARWAARVSAWQRGEQPADASVVAPRPARRKSRDVYVYFDNDVKVRAPFDAQNLAARLGLGPPAALPKSLAEIRTKPRTSWRAWAAYEGRSAE